MAVRSLKRLPDDQHGDDDGGKESLDSSTNDGASIRTLARGLSIIRCFNIDQPALSFGEIRKQVGLGNATTHRLVKTLEAEGFLTLEQATNKYHLGPCMLSAAYLTMASDELARIAHPHMQKLVDLTGDTVDLGIWTEQGILHAHVVFTARPFRPVQRVGQIFDDFCNASAKLFLAFGPQSRRQAILARTLVPKTEYSITDPEKLASELDRVRYEGVAYDLEENTIGICAVGAPVWDSTGEIRAVITITPPVERFGPTEMRRCAEAVKETAAAVSRDLGYMGNPERVFSD